MPFRIAIRTVTVLGVFYAHWRAKPMNQHHAGRQSCRHVHAKVAGQAEDRVGGALAVTSPIYRRGVDFRTAAIARS
jgi:hypothetical protein